MEERKRKKPGPAAPRSPEAGGASLRTGGGCAEQRRGAEVGR